MADDPMDDRREYDPAEQLPISVMVTCEMCSNPAAVETITGRGDFSVFAGMSNGLLLNWSHPWEQPLDIAQLDATIQDTPDNPIQTQFQTALMECRLL